MILMEYLLAQRYTIWGWIAGIPHERLIGYHRIHGWSLYTVFFAHMVCMAHGMRQRVDGLPITRQVDSPMSIMAVNPALGIAAFVMWTVTAFSALDVIRRNAWGFFYLSHFSFFPALSLTLFHNRPRNLPWIAASVGFFYIDVGTRAWMKFMRKSKVEAAEVLPGDVAKLTISTGKSMAYEAGQYVWLALPGLPGPEPLPSLSFHPYSISSSYAPGDATYTLHVKSMGAGTWSEAVVLAAAGGADAFKGGCRIGGPAGRFSINPVHFERIVLVAGGIGMTPLMSLLTDIARDAGVKDGAKRRYPAATHVTLLWAVQSAACLSWFAEELEAARAATGVSVDLQLFVTRAKEADAEGQAAFKVGRPNLADALAAVAQLPGAAPVGVFACGPQQMLDDCAEAVAAGCAAAGGDAAKRMLLHVETFLF
jgi:NAD(P)H-flavin reductase